MTRRPTVAIVGTRKPSAYGLDTTQHFSSALARQGVVIISGLAHGIDGAAHRAALDAGGTTIAVMAHGLDMVHPRYHAQLAADIIRSGGALISEYAPGVPAYRDHFVARNRIVSGLSDIVLVIEAATKSGTLHTAGFAAEQGRTVCAVPGNIDNPLSAGCNQLLRTGAVLVTSPEDVLEEMGLKQNESAQVSLPFGDTPAEQAIIDLLATGTKDGSELQGVSGLTASDYSVALSMLQIKGVVRPLGADRWALRR